MEIKNIGSDMKEERRLFGKKKGTSGRGKM
jgi:hypothetical protein